jgi:hypothetical protein
VCRLTCIKKGKDGVVICRGKRLHDGDGKDQGVVLTCCCIKVLFIGHVTFDPGI